jgi:hypothetical protein
MCCNEALPHPTVKPGGDIRIAEVSIERRGRKGFVVTSTVPDQNLSRTGNCHLLVPKAVFVDGAFCRQDLGDGGTGRGAVSRWHPGTRAEWEQAGMDRAAHAPWTAKLARLNPDMQTQAISTVHAVLDRHGLVKGRVPPRYAASPFHAVTNFRV